MQKGSGQAVKPTRLQGVKRDIARVKTVLNEPEFRQGVIGRGQSTGGRKPRRGSVMGREAKTSRTLVGQVVSNKMEKTIAVAVERQVLHPLYKKYIRRTTKLLAHDEDNECLSQAIWWPSRSAGRCPSARAGGSKA